MTRLALLARPQPLLGIFAIVLGWSLSHQVGSDSIFDDCSRGGPLVIVVSLIGLLVTAGGGFYCLAAWRGSEHGRSFLGALGVLLALIAGFAIVLEIAAGIILPSCAG